MTPWLFALAFHTRNIYKHVPVFLLCFNISTFPCRFLDGDHTLPSGQQADHAMEHIMAELWKVSPRSKNIVKVPVDIVEALELEEPRASAIQGSTGQMAAGSLGGWCRGQRHVENSGDKLRAGSGPSRRHGSGNGRRGRRIERSQSTCHG